MAQQIQIRRDTASNWTSVNPTLAVGEYGYETDTDKLKLGDGSTAWNSLGYMLAPVLISSPISGEVLKYDGTYWVNDQDISGTGAIAGHESIYDHDAYDQHLVSGELHRQINDSAYGDTDLWSAEQISGELVSKSDTTHLHDDRYYTETEANGLFEPSGHTHDEYAESGHIHDNRYYTEAEADGLFSASGHLHDDRYYTETEADGLFEASGAVAAHESAYDHDDFALSGHAHAINDLSDVTIGSPVSGEILKYNGSQWTNGEDVSGGTGSVDAHEASYDHDLYDTHIASGEIHRTIDDAGYGSIDLWSAEQISGELVSKSDTGHSHNDLYYTEAEADGLFAASGHVHDDIYETSGAVAGHEAAWDHDNFALSGHNHDADYAALDHDHDADYEASGAVTGHEFAYDHEAYDDHLASGELHRTIDDAGYADTDLWSAQQISGQLQQSFLIQISAGMDAPNTTNQYLRGPGDIPMNLGGFSLPFDSTLAGITMVGGANNDIWNTEVRKNDGITVLAWLNITNAYENHDFTQNVDFDAGDRVQLYMSGTAVNRPSVTAFFTRRIG